MDRGIAPGAENQERVLRKGNEIPEWFGNVIVEDWGSLLRVLFYNCIG